MKTLTIIFLPPLNRQPRVYHAEWFEARNNILVFLENGRRHYIPFMSILHFSVEEMEGDE